MACWIKGPERYSWPANRRPMPETPHEAAIAVTEEETKPRRRRSTKKADD